MTPEDRLAGALLELAPVVDVDAAWGATTSRVAGRRRRRAMGMGAVAAAVVLLAGVIGLILAGRSEESGLMTGPDPVAVPGTTLGVDAAVPDEVVITCDGGAGSLSTEIVRTQPDGVHVWYRGGVGGGRITIGPPGGGSGTAVKNIPADQWLQHPEQQRVVEDRSPGTVEVRCDEPQAPDHPLFEPTDPMLFEVVDPAGRYVPRPDDRCARHWREEWDLGDAGLAALAPAVAARFGDTATIAPFGYPSGERATQGVWIDDRLVAGLFWFRSDPTRSGEPTAADQPMGPVTVGLCEDIPVPDGEVIGTEWTVRTPEQAIEAVRADAAEPAYVGTDWPTMDQVTRIEAKLVRVDDLGRRTEFGVPVRPPTFTTWVVMASVVEADGSPGWYAFRPDPTGGPLSWSRQDEPIAWPDWWDDLPDRYRAAG